MGTLFFCIGTGRTGKTVVAEKLEQQGWLRHKSPTRGFFQSRGINSEGDLFARSQPERARIQRDYFDFFMEDLIKITTSEKLGEKQVNIIFERGPLDMMAYLMFHDWSMTHQEYQSYISRIIGFFKTTTKQGWSNVIGLFPFPTQWMLKTLDTDQFRYSMFGKDFTIHSLIHGIHYSILEHLEHLTLEDFIVWSVVDGSVEERVTQISSLAA